MGFEIQIIQVLQAGRSDFFDVVFRLISNLGSVLGIVFLSVILLCFNFKLLIFWLSSYGVTALSVAILKNYVKRIRPFNLVDSIQNLAGVVTDYSFPSGHAACATAIAIFFGYFLFKQYKSKLGRLLIVLCMMMYVALVCISRMYLGVHYLSDVLAGVAAGALVCSCGLFSLKLFDETFAHSNNKKDV